MVKILQKNLYVIVSLSLLNRQTGEETTSIQNNVVTIVPNPKANFSFLETSINHDDNKLKCEKCENYVNSSKKIVFWDLAPVLIILLKKYTLIIILTLH